MSIKLDLTVDEVNGILSALGNKSYVEVAPLIDKIKEQGIPQVAAATTVEESVAKPELLEG